VATRIREKARAREKNKDTRPRAVAKYIRMSPRKVKAVIDLIRGKKVNEALAVLANTPRAAAQPVLKVLKSAVANAENNMNMGQDNLYVAEIYANQGPTLKRIRPRARGMAYRIRKRTSHITVVLDEIKK
jgi:large subunit ribosomal protein L22